MLTENQTPLEMEDYDFIESLDEMHQNYKESLKDILLEQGYFDIFNKYERILKVKNSVKDDFYDLRDSIYVVIYSSVRRKRTTVEDICTIRDGSIYKYNESRRLPLYKFADKYEVIKKNVLENCMDEKKEAVKDLFERIENSKIDLHKLGQIIEKEEVTVKTSKLPTKYDGVDSVSILTAGNTGNIVIMFKDDSVVEKKNLVTSSDKSIDRLEEIIKNVDIIIESIQFCVDYIEKGEEGIVQLYYDISKEFCMEIASLKI